VELRPIAITHDLDQPLPTRHDRIEMVAKLCRGEAYGTHDAPLQYNVMVGTMSIDPSAIGVGTTKEDPSHAQPQKEHQTRSKQ
jgi:hypothetical protein